MTPLRVIASSHEPADFDTAVSSAILRRVALHEIGPTLRIYVPRRVVAFGSQDRIQEGYPQAIAAARSAGFDAIERLAGGRAAVFHEGTVAFAWATPHDDAKVGIEQRFEDLARIVLTALASLGVTGRVGETPGEYCPGRFSVHAAGRKVMGVGQRLIKGAAHVGGVLVAHSPELVNLPLIPVYRHLGYDWSPDATGALDDSGSIDVGQAVDALLAAFSAHGHDLVTTAIEPATLAMARDLAVEHSAPIA